jgi:sulfatase modifying factor 1
LSTVLSGFVVCPLLGSACGGLGPEGQVLLYVTTDAPVQPAPGRDLTADDPSPLFDRIRFDLYEPDQLEPCRNCTREFRLTGETLQAGRLSLGIRPLPERTGYRVRVRIFHGEFVSNRDPIPRTTLETFLSIPSVRTEGVIEGTVHLPVTSVGKPVGRLQSPVAWTPGPPSGGEIRTWTGARRLPCAKAAAENEACIRGGAFWMGRPSVSGGIHRDDLPHPRLVVISPFFLDQTEVTVGALRRWMLARETANTNLDPFPTAELVSSPERFHEWCTFPKDLDDGSRDGLPVNCISSAQAKEYCRTRDPDHPSTNLATEAQLEYAATATTGWHYPWGYDEPTCDDAVYAMAGGGIDLDRYPSGCSLDQSSHGPAETGSRQRDSVRPADGGRIVDLAGNLAELAADVWAPQSGECWSQSLLEDPICEGSAQGGRAVRGGSWASEPYDLQSAFRWEKAHDEKTHLGPFVGFRCSRGM